MDRFLSLVFSFPTVIFTVLLAVAIIYWLISLSGLGDIGDGELDASPEFSGLMVTLGLQGVPLPLVLTLLFLSAWLTSYFADLWFGALFGTGLMHTLFGVLVVIVAVIAGLMTTVVLVRPLRPLFRRAYDLPLQKRIIGTACVILSEQVTERSGRADALLDGAHLILQVRSDRPLARRERAVLVEYLPDQKAYWVIPEVEFHSGSLTG